MLYNLISLWLLICFSDDRSRSDNINAVMLTAHEWRLYSTGLDLNNDGNITGDEECILPCQIDDTYAFYKNGTAALYDNDLHCSGAAEQLSSWRLDNDQLRLNLFQATVRVVNKDTLRLIARSDGNMNYIISVFNPINEKNENAAR